MERLTDPGKIIIPRITDLQSFEYAKVYERLKEYENAVDAEEFLTFRHAKEHSLLPAFQHIVIAKVLNGTASIKYEKEEDDHIKVSICDYKGVNLINVSSSMIYHSLRLLYLMRTETERQQQMYLIMLLSLRGA